MSYSKKELQIVVCDFCPENDTNEFLLDMSTSSRENDLFITGWARMTGEPYVKAETHICPSCIRIAVVKTYVA